MSNKQRLVSNPTYNIVKNTESKYKATIMMLMDCECQPFSDATLMRSLQDLYINYNTATNNVSYNIAKKLLTTDRVNIVGVNQVPNENNRTTIAVYDYNGNMVEIHPSYSTLAYQDIDDGLKHYTIYLNKFNLRENKYWKIYDTKINSYLFAIINIDELDDYNKKIYERGSIDDYRILISRLFNVNHGRYIKPIVLGVTNNTTDDEIKFGILQLLMENGINCTYDLTTDYYLKFSAQYINEPLLNNCNGKIDTKASPLSKIKAGDETLSEYDNKKWYAYRIKITDITKSFYFTVRYGPSRVMLLSSVNVNELNTYDMSRIDSSDSHRAAVLQTIFKTDMGKYDFHDYIPVRGNQTTEEEFEEALKGMLKKYGILYDYNSYIDKDTGEFTRYLTIYTNKITDSTVSNLEVEEDRKKSYDIDYLTNYDRMIFSMFSKQATTIDNIRVSISRYNERYSIQIYNQYYADVVDTESFTSTDIFDLVYNINTYSKYIGMYIYRDYLEPGDYVLSINNVDTNMYDYKYLESINSMNKDFIINNNIDIIYNTKNDMTFINAWNNLVNQCDRRVLLFTDNAETIRDVERYNVSQIKSNIPKEYIDEDELLLKDIYIYKDLWVLHKKCILTYNDPNSSLFPEEYLTNSNELINIEPIDKTKPYTTISWIAEQMKKEYNNLAKEKFAKSIEYIFKNEILKTDFKGDAISEISVMTNSESLKTDYILGKLTEDEYNEKVLSDGNHDGYENYVIHQYGYYVDWDLTNNSDIVYIRDRVNNITEIRSDTEFYGFIAYLGYTYESFINKTTAWSYNEEIIPKVIVQKYCAEELNKHFDNIMISRRSYNVFEQNTDTTFQILYNIFARNEFEFDISDKLHINYLDNEDTFTKELADIYCKDKEKIGIVFNNLYDNEYYYSMLNPIVTWGTYKTSLQECLPAVLQINHVINSIVNNSATIATENDCNNIIKLAIEDVGKIVNLVDKLVLTDFNKSDRKLYLKFSIELSYSIHKSFDFNITINI